MANAIPTINLRLDALVDAYLDQRRRRGQVQKDSLREQRRALAHLVVSFGNRPLIRGEDRVLHRQHEA